MQRYPGKVRVKPDDIVRQRKKVIKKLQRSEFPFSRLSWIGGRLYIRRHEGIFEIPQQPLLPKPGRKAIGLDAIKLNMEPNPSRSKTGRSHSEPSYERESYRSQRVFRW